MTFSVEVLMNQLGGRRLIVMTGSKDFVKGKNFLRFRLPRANKGIRIVKIKLNSMDTYDITFMRLNGKVVKSVDDIYFDQLPEVFERNTGLRTRL